MPVFTIPPRPETRGRPRVHFADRAATGAETKRTWRAAKEVARAENIAIWDTETDPFDKNRPDDRVEPFVGCLYSPNFEPIVIWDEDFQSFTEKTLAVFEDLPEPYTIYAHNGGKFDFMFLIHKLRGKVSFKGRGIMSAKIGPHELRDSFHIIPEKLSAFHKETFDYKLMHKSRRNKHRDEIIKYLISDCVYLYDFVRSFVDRFGFKISIGQAAMAEMKKEYKVGRLGPNTDATLRQWFFGGRVECLAGKGQFIGDYNLYDVNSMYPAVMHECEHPISSNYERRTQGGVNRHTVFVDLTCDNYGALVKRTEAHETSATEGRGRYFTTIWEYQAALDLGLIDRITIHACIDNPERSTFSRVILPWYEKKQETRRKLDALEAQGLDEDDPEYLEVKKDYLFWKYLLNNSYGKYAQNPRNYKEHFFTGWNDPAPEGFEAGMLPVFRSEAYDYAIWEKPADRQLFNNVGTAASITGASRAKLMRAIHGATDPIYCDTDSLICKAIGADAEIDPSKLGAWKLEKQFSEVVIAGKKLYACRDRLQKDKVKLKSKGASGLVYEDMMKLLRGEVVETVNAGPTLNRTGVQFYMRRKIKATATERDRTNGRTYEYDRVSYR